jgi:hypothetical protein
MWAFGQVPKAIDMFSVALFLSHIDILTPVNFLSG